MNPQRGPEGADGTRSPLPGREQPPLVLNAWRGSNLGDLPWSPASQEGRTLTEESGYLAGPDPKCVVPRNLAGVMPTLGLGLAGQGLGCQVNAVDRAGRGRPPRGRGKMDAGGEAGPADVALSAHSRS